MARQPSFELYTIAALREKSNVLKVKLSTEIKSRLDNRPLTDSYLESDDIIFEPYADILTSLTIGEELYSYTLQLGSDALREVELFEQENNLKVNKRHLFFGLSINSIYMNDTINGMIYWELTQKEDAMTLGINYSPEQALHDTLNKFTSVVNPLTSLFNRKSLFVNLKNQYAFIENFDTLLFKLQIPEIFSFFSCSLRYKQVSYWIENDFTDMTKMYAQELINSLCILCEASLKDIPAVTEKMLGNILNSDIPNIDPALATVLGHSHPKPNTGFFQSHLTQPDSNFDSSLQNIINSIKTLNLNDHELKAHLLYLTYMMRNNSLHDVKSNLAYYNNSPLFGEIIILLFCSISMIRNL